MNYYYYQVKGGNEKWRPLPETKLDMLEDAMFCTILSVDNPVTETSPKEAFDALKYRGPLYFDMDDHMAPGSTAKHTVELVNKLSDLGVLPTMLQIYTSGGKGFHVLVPEECFLAKPPKAGFANLPATYKEMAFELSVQSMDFRVYTACRGRMFRRPNILRPNGLYKVQISWDELQAIADSDDAEGMYKSISSAPRKSLDVESDMPELSSELLALFDLSRAKVSKRRSSKSKRSKITLPDKLPSLEALLRGEGIKESTGFHELAFQVALTAHAKGMSREELLESSTGLCENHQSDGDRYNSPGKRRAELARMWDYMLDNPCYEYSGKAVANLLTHNAPDLRGYDVDADELDLEVPEPNEKGQYDHAGLMLTRRGAFVPTEEGPRQISGLAFDNVTELVSVDNNQVTVMEADVVIAGKTRGRAIFDLDTFNSSTRLNSMYMKYGQSFAGNDVQARGTFLRMVERAQKGDRRMYCVSREGLDVISIPFHEDEDLRTPFLVWSDPLEVSPEQRVKDKGLQFKFVGFPKERGSFECDLSMAPSLSQWLKEPGNDLVFREVLTAVMACQKPEYIGKLVGWMIACHYRMLFHKLIGQFPLMHINGAAGAGKCLRRGTLVIKADGTSEKIENIVVGDKLLGPDGGVRNVLELGRGRETMYKVTPVKGDPYYVNASHILSLKRSYGKSACKLSDGTVVPKEQQILNVNVRVFADSTAATQKYFKGYRAEAVEFHREQAVLPVDPYWLGAWLGDGSAGDVTITKPEGTKLVAWLHDYAESLGMDCVKYSHVDRCPGWAIVTKERSRRGVNLLRHYLKRVQYSGKHIPQEYKLASVEDRLKLIAGLLDSDGSLSNGGYDWISRCPKLAEDLVWVCRSVGLAAYMVPCTKGIKSTGFSGTYYRVSISGDCERIPCLDKKAPPRKQIKNHLVTGLTFQELEEEDYYGVVIDGDHLFLLGDFTVTHNTQTTKALTYFHYYNTEPKMMSPSSTIFAFQYAAAGSASIPLLLDEYKPQDMRTGDHERYKLLLRDAYNCRQLEKGGGTRDNKDYRAVHETNLSAPIAYIAEAAESESAVIERSILLTMVKPPAVQAQAYSKNYHTMYSNRHVLSMIGKYIAAGIVRNSGVDQLRAEFMPVFDDAKYAMMLRPGEVASLDNQDRASAKERTVFNYAVAKFGLQKLRNLAVNALGDEQFGVDVFDPALATSFEVSSAVSANTIPEWLKVLNHFAHMTQVDPALDYFLVAGKDFAYVNYGGRDCIELYTISCYYKYRSYCNSSRTKPLFPSQEAFKHSLDNLPATVASGVTVSLSTPGGSHLLDLAELRASGFQAP